MIIVSVAHSMRDKGASNSMHHLSEYDVSKAASIACVEALRAHGLQVAMYDAGYATQMEYARFKVDFVNACKPDLAVEIHCNSSLNTSAKYSEVIYYPGSVAKDAAEDIAKSMSDAMGRASHSWPSHGARADADLFFLRDTMYPSVIVEGLFISNDEQARWLASESAPETYGALVAAGILDFKKRSAS